MNRILALFVLFVLGLGDSRVEAQRIRFPASTPANTTAFQGGAATAPSIGSSGTAPVPQNAPATTLGAPSTFDPYAAPLGAPATNFGSPSATQTPAPTYSQPQLYSQPSDPLYSSPYQNYPPPQPPVLFPNGLMGSGQQPFGGAPGAGGYGYPASPLRLTQNVRMMATWLEGSGGNELDINDFDFAAMFAYPNFGFTGQPLFITPGFVLHLWDGPSGGAADLPSRAYSAFIETAWKSDPNRQFGGEVSASFGIYSDFNSLTQDSFRIQGLGLLTFRLTPTLTVKGGVNYLDRAEIKMLPAGGVLWEPNPHTRFDIFFPRPKLAQYLTTLGNSDVWWYVGGEYGGGNWTVERTAGPTERVDINDIRVMLGLEWTNSSGIKGMTEIGYVWDREIVYVESPGDSISLSSTWMVRGGLSY